MKKIRKLLKRTVELLGSEYADGAIGSALNRGFCHCYKDKASKTVRVHFYFNANQNINTNTYLFTIPSGFRPSEDETGVMMYTDSSNVSGAFTCKITTNGVVTQNAGSTIRQGFGFIEYAVGGVVSRLLDLLAPERGWAA